MLLLQDGSLLAATINGFPLSTAKITEKRKIIEEIALADVKKVRHYFSHHRSSFTRPIYLLYSSLTLSLYYFCLLHSVCFYKQNWEIFCPGCFFKISTFPKNLVLYLKDMWYFFFENLKNKNIFFSKITNTVAKKIIYTPST